MMRIVPIWAGLAEHDDRIDQVTLAGTSTPTDDQSAVQKPPESVKSIVEEFVTPEIG